MDTTRTGLYFYVDCQKLSAAISVAFGHVIEERFSMHWIYYLMMLQREKLEADTVVFLETLYRCLKKAKETMMAAVAATVAKINALRLRRLRSTKRVSYNESFGDILSQSVPTPPTSRYAGTSFSVRNAAY